MVSQSGAAPSGPFPVVVRMESFKMAGQRTNGLPVLVHAGDEVRRLALGDNPLPLPPGVRQVRVWCLYYMFKVGRAEATVDTRSGQPVLLHYTAPRTIYSRGVLADGPVPRPGRGVLVGMWVGVFVLVAVMAAIIAIAELTSG